MASRKVWIRLHRYAGLAMALFLTIAGLPGRIVICITGIVVAMLSVIGVVIWLKKRRSRQVRGAYSPLNEPARHAFGIASHKHD